MSKWAPITTRHWFVRQIARKRSNFRSIMIVRITNKSSQPAVTMVTGLYTRVTLAHAGHVHATSYNLRYNMVFFLLSVSKKIYRRCHQI